MKLLCIGLTFFIGQLDTHQTKPLVHLPPHQTAIPAGFRGDLLELINTPASISLPAVVVSKGSAQGEPWFVDVKNLGPHGVIITGTSNFILKINVGQTVHIYVNGTRYNSLPSR